MASTDENEQPQEPEQSQEPEQPQVVAVVDAEDEEPAFYRVQPTDRWESIAEAHGLDVTDLLALNADRPHHSDRSVPVNQFVRVK